MNKKMIKLKNKSKIKLPCHQYKKMIQITVIKIAQLKLLIKMMKIKWKILKLS